MLAVRFLPIFLFVLFCWSCDADKGQYREMRPETYLLYEQVNRLLNSGQYARSIDYLDSAYAKMDDVLPSEQWNRYYHLTRYFLNYVSNVEMADLYKDSMGIAIEGIELIYKTEYAKTFFIKGDVLKADKKFSEAFKSYYEGIVFAREHLCPCQTADLTYQLGLFKYNQREYREAILIIKKAIEEVAQCPEGADFVLSIKDPQMYLNTIALAFEKVHELDSAVGYYTKALDFIESKADLYPSNKSPAEANFVEVARGVILGNLGGVLSEMESFEKAEVALLESIAINDRPGYDIPDARTAKVKLGDLYLRTNRNEEALKVIEDLEASIKTIEVKNASYENILGRLYRLRWKYYDKIKDVDAAYKSLLAYMDLYNASEAKAIESRYLDMEASFRNTEQQLQLSNITRENDLKRIYLIGSVIISLIAIGFLIAVWYHLKKYRLVNKQISIQNIELQDALGALEQSQAENSKMMHIVAHDLRSPISSMTMIADVLLESEYGTEEDRTLLEHIKISGTNSLNLVSEMMQVNKGSEGLKKEMVDLERMISYCVDLLRYRALEKKQKIIIETIPVTAHVSREKMWRVMSNLIANAIKFSEPGSNVTIRLTSSQDKALISVQDLGIGIPDTIKDSVFELFTNSKRVGTAGETPYGMGLAISKQIVLAHEGKIWFVSKEGEGTTFFVELPLE